MSLIILHQSSWAVSHLGNFIELYEGKIEDPSKIKSPILFIGGVHGDEPEGVRLASDLLSYLQKNNSTQAQPWLLIPCLNIDGYLKKQRTNGRGVDLNRNFPTEDWTSVYEKERYYPGLSPESELETKALVQLIKTKKPKLIIHFHSWTPCIVFTGHLGKEAAQKLAKASSFPLQESIGYPTPGSLGDYGWRVEQIPVICIEAPEIKKEDDLNELWPRFGQGLIEVLNL